MSEETKDQTAADSDSTAQAAVSPEAVAEAGEAPAAPSADEAKPGAKEPIKIELEDLTEEGQMPIDGFTGDAALAFFAELGLFSCDSPISRSCAIVRFSSLGDLP